MKIETQLVLQRDKESLRVSAAERHRDIQRDTGIFRETQGYQERHRETQRECCREKSE